MPRSMTGFSRSEQQYSWGSLTWELRSVNHRYLETNFRMSEGQRVLEQPLRDIVRKKLSRGKLDISLHFNITDKKTQGINVDKALAAQVMQAAEVISTLGPCCAINPLEVLKWPGVLSESSIDPEQIQQDALAQFGPTIDQLLEARQREGTELGNFIEQRLQSISEQVVIVRKLMPTILQAQREKLQERLSVLQVELDNDRIEQEIVLLAQKADVDEELDRLDTHVIEVRHTLQQKNAIGRRLDFLMQELNREANTLSSKSIVTDTTAAAVELKVLIEQMREQIQNIE